MVATTIGTAFPVAGAEGHDSTVTAAHASAAVGSHAAMVTHVRRLVHHLGTTVAVAIHGITASGERASKAGRATLEVGEATRGAGPVARARTVLAGREGGEDLGGAIEDAAGGGRDFNGLFIERAAIHAEALGGLFVGGEDGEAGAGGFVLIGGAQGPKCNGATAKLSEPALELRLGGIVGQAGHVQDLATLREKGAHVGAGIHGPGEDVRVFVRGLGLANQAAEDAGQRDGLLHGATGAGGGQGLEMKGQIVLDGGTRLHRLDLEGSTDIGEHRGPKGQRLGVMLLPALVLGAQVKGARVLEVGGQHDGLVAGFTGQLDTQIPGIQGDKGKVEIRRGQMLRGKGVEAINGIAKGAGVANVFPGEGGQAG